MLFGMMLPLEIGGGDRDERRAEEGGDCGVPGDPETETHAATRSPVVASTSGYRQGIAVRQWRQRPRRNANESSGRLSYHASGVAQAMQADRG